MPIPTAHCDCGCEADNKQCQNACSNKKKCLAALQPNADPGGFDNDREKTVEIIGNNTLIENGHMTYSRDGRWILSDTYPDADTNVRLLLLFDTANNSSYNIGEFFTPPDLGKHNRCDLHPRFSPDNRHVTIDSMHEGSRQQYIVDVSELVFSS